MSFKKLFWLIPIVFASFAIGCASSAQEVSAEELMELTKQWKEPKVAVWYYEGTDEAFHYFEFIDLDASKIYKVRKIEIEIEIKDPVPVPHKKGSIRRVMPWGPLGIINENS